MIKDIYRNTYIILMFGLIYLSFGFITKKFNNTNYLENEKITVLNNEVSLLKNDLNIYKNKKYSYKIGRITFKNPYNLIAGAIIYLGKDDNIKEGMYVINNDYIIGIVTNTKKEYAYFDFIKNNHLPVNINGYLGTICNEENNLLVVCNINNYENIRVGDIAYTIRDSLNPISYKVGIVTKISNNNNYEKTIHLDQDISLVDIQYGSIFVW